MSRRSRMNPLAPAVLLLGAALGATLFVPAVWADGPVCANTSPLKPGDLKVWPLHERLADDTPGETRSSLMNDFGEFQDIGSVYVHTGIDIRGLWNSGTGEGDLVQVVADGDVWAVPQFGSDVCVSQNLCRVYIKSNDRRYIYYHAHLNVRNGTGSVDSEVRSQLQTAAMNDPKANLNVGANPVMAGQKLAGLGPFNANGKHSHLHFAIFDVCENYDGINPLAVLPAPTFQGKKYFDATKPTIGPIHFLNEDDKTEVIAAACDKPLTGVVDIAVDAKDAYHDLTAAVPAFPGTDSNGVYKAIYRLRRLPSGMPTYDGTWYELNQAPLRCRGAARGKSCADPIPANALLLTQDDFIDNEAHLPPLGDGGAELAVTYAGVLFDNVPGPFESNSEYFANERYVHLLTHEWGRPDAPGKWDTTAMPDGLYQVSAEVADLAGNRAASHAYVIVANHPGGPGFTGDLLMRDNPTDGGAVPSSLGDTPFWISPDVKVVAPGDPDPTDPADPAWNGTQDVTVKVGTKYKVWLRVQNHGCQTIDDVRAKVAFADPAMIQTSWKQIGVEMGGFSLAAAEAKVIGPFLWTPGATEVGHRCLLAISRSTQDPPSVAGFGAIVDGWGGTVAGDSDITQLNLQVAKESMFKLNAPVTAEGRARLRFDCNGFPLDEERALAALVTDDDPQLEASWKGLPNTELTHEGTSLVLRFAACRVELPLDALAGGRAVNASMRLELGPGPAASYPVDLSEQAAGKIAGGMSFTISRP